MKLYETVRQLEKQNWRLIHHDVIQHSEKKSYFYCTSHSFIREGGGRTGFGWLGGRGGGGWLGEF